MTGSQSMLSLPCSATTSRLLNVGQQRDRTFSLSRDRTTSQGMGSSSTPVWEGFGKIPARREAGRPATISGPNRAPQCCGRSSSGLHGAESPCTAAQAGRRRGGERRRAAVSPRPPSSLSRTRARDGPVRLTAAVRFALVARIRARSTGAGERRRTFHLSGRGR